MTTKQIRQPIITIVGHVDHGKTSILDQLRSSCIQEGEAGGITQKISFTLYPLKQLKKACPLIDESKLKLNIPGFLLIDTPGHAAFTNLRKRGGSLADLAVLVIDVNEGIKPQTAEVIQILKHNKTPFIIALNKIDNIGGWMPQHSTIGGTLSSGKQDLDLKKNIEMQPEKVKQIFNEKYMTLIGSLSSYGFESDLYYNIEDYTKKIALVPCSATSGQGIQELIMILCGLSEKFLTKRLKLNKDPKGVMLEIKKEKSTNYIEAILYDGELNKSDTIAVSNFEGEPILTKIRILEEIQPLCSKFKPVEKATAATGIRMQLISPREVSSGDKTEILPGMPFMLYKNNLEEIKSIFKKEISENIKTDKQGIIVKADSLGSLEALLVLLKQNNIPVLKAGIGTIRKSDLVCGKANAEINELNCVIVGFNVKIDEDVKEICEKTKIITNKVVYKLIEDLIEFRKKKQAEIEKNRLMKLSTICKLEILHQYVFRNTKPAIFGVKILGGKLISNLPIVNEKDEKIGNIKNIQSENKSVQEAREGLEVAISIPGLNYDRELKDKKYLYSNLGESQFKEFKKNKDLLSNSEMKILQEIAELKRKTSPEWGM